MESLTLMVLRGADDMRVMLQLNYGREHPNSIILTH